VVGWPGVGLPGGVVVGWVRGFFRPVGVERCSENRVGQADCNQIWVVPVGLVWGFTPGGGGRFVLLGGYD